MFYLGGSEFPKTREELVAAVSKGLRELIALPTAGEPVRIDPSRGDAQAGDYPVYASVAINLTGARLIADQPPPKSSGTAPSQPAGVAERFELAGHPLIVREAAVDLSIVAADAKFDFDRNAAGRPILILSDAREGNINVELRKADLDALILAGAKEGAAKQGVQILDAQLALTQASEHAVSAEVRIRAKKMFLTATLHLRGMLSVDEDLNAVVSGLSVTGEGMLGDMASAGIRPYLQKVEGMHVPLTALPIGNVRLRELRMIVGDPIRVTATFGSGGAK